MTAVATLPPKGFVAWVQEHYDASHKPRSTYVCKRCGLPVLYVTKHAGDVHGDSVDIRPVILADEQVKRWTDVFGPDTANGIWPDRRVDETA